MQNNLQIFNPEEYELLKNLETENKDKYTGFFYILEWDNIVKIGSTKNPYQRIMSLKRIAENYGSFKIGKIAFSIPHTNYSENERRLHSFFSQYRKTETELFNIEFKKVIEEFPKDIEYLDESKELEARSEEVFNALKRFVLEGTFYKTPSLNKESIIPVSQSVDIFNNIITSIVESLKETILSNYRPIHGPWFYKMDPKYTLLENYFNITRGQLYKNILWELENRYGLDTQQIQSDYCYEHGLDKCYPMEPYEYNPKYRAMIETIVNEALVKFNIVTKDDPIASTKHITIFDLEIKGCQI